MANNTSESSVASFMASVDSGASFSSASNNSSNNNSSNSSNYETIGDVPLKEKRAKKFTHGNIDFQGKLICAPLTTTGNLPYRRIVKSYGADITVGEMAMAQNLTKGQGSEWALIKKHKEEDPFGVQICGSNLELMTKTVELLLYSVKPTTKLSGDSISDADRLGNRHGIDFIDLNCGCPIDIVYNKGMGSALLNRPKRLKELVIALAGVLSSDNDPDDSYDPSNEPSNSHTGFNTTIPMTVKIRMGTANNQPTVHEEVVPYVHQWGAAALTIHGRYRQQRYKLKADWEYINKCSKVCQIPLIGNGDIYNHVDARNYLNNTGVDSLMLARGALIKPWLFKEIKEDKEWDISSSERFEILKTYCNYGLEHWGSDTVGVENTRFFLLNWLSFLHRYIPVGILEHHPIRITDRPSPFMGRDDLETLMASRKIPDWLKLTEMILGPVRDKERFENFAPKHEAAAWTENREDSIPEQQ